MKITLVFLLLILLTACGRTDDIGGRLPMVATDWDGETDGDILHWFTSSGYLESPLPETADLAEIVRIGDDFPVPRAMAAKMLALAYTDPHTINAWAKYPSIDFTDVSSQRWYYKYINAAYVTGQMRGGGEAFRPSDMLTLYEAGLLMTNLNPSGPGLQVTKENRDMPISYALWVDLFVHYLAGTGADSKIETLQIIPLAHNNATERVITNIGAFSSFGINMEGYLDKEIKVLARGGEILALLGQITNQPILRNAFIVDADTFGLTIFLGGATRFYGFDSGVEPLPDGTIIADIQIYNGTILSATPADTVIRGTIEQVSTRRIVLREWGAVPLRPQFAVYSAYNGIEQPTAKSPADLIVGANMAYFHMTGGAIGAAVITDIASPVYIRVLIGTSNFAGLVHNNVNITATGPFTVQGESVDKTLAQGEVFTATDLADGSRFYIQPVNPEHRLEIIGLARNQSTPLYRGRIEIARTDGGFVIVNELPLEEYLYAVVPSEMPSYFGVEAAKVQAITARTFAIHQFYENRFRAFGAHVDDSIISQVYNNIPENDISREAVRATAGMVLTHNGDVILANYFSTSSGVTTNFGEVWAAGGTFPAFTPPYLVSQFQFDIDDISDRALRNAARDLSQEENADLFFRTTDIPAFESDLPWFRWQVRMTVDELSQSINANLASRQQATPAMIHALDNTGASTGRPISSIGRLTSMAVTHRGQGGNVMEIVLSGTDGNVRVQTEFNIRTLLAPRTATVTRHNGTTVSNLPLMPSGFFSIEKETDTSGNLVAVIFHGGGHGHGVGMSQNGANVLLNLGYSFLDVLRHYYPEAEITRLSS